MHPLDKDTGLEGRKLDKTVVFLRIKSSTRPKVAALRPHSPTSQVYYRITILSDFVGCWNRTRLPPYIFDRRFLKKGGEMHIGQDSRETVVCE